MQIKKKREEKCRFDPSKPYIVGWNKWSKLLVITNIIGAVISACFYFFTGSDGAIFFVIMFLICVLIQYSYKNVFVLIDSKGITNEKNETLLWNDMRLCFADTRGDLCIVMNTGQCYTFYIDAYTTNYMHLCAAINYHAGCEMYRKKPKILLKIAIIMFIMAIIIIVVLEIFG